MTRETSQIGRYEYCRYLQATHYIKVFESPSIISKAHRSYFLEKYSVHVTTWGLYSVDWLEIVVDVFRGHR